jgi:hypothetical protein
MDSRFRGNDEQEQTLMTSNTSILADTPPTVAQRNLTALATIVRREVNRILRIWGQTLVPPAITMTLYFLIFGGLIGSRVGKMDGIGYMDFIVPGLVMMSVIQNSYANISSSFFGAKFGRHVEELLVSPMPNWVILGGYVAGAVLRGLLVGIIVLLIETDAPYLLPRTVRPQPSHRRNEPMYLAHIVGELARDRGEDVAVTAARTTANARAFFGLPAVMQPA